MPTPAFASWVTFAAPEASAWVNAAPCDGNGVGDDGWSAPGPPLHPATAAAQTTATARPIMRHRGIMFIRAASPALRLKMPP